MNLQQRIGLLVELGKYMAADAPEWLAARDRASAENGWFIPAFVDTAVNGITGAFLQEDKLRAWADRYTLPAQTTDPKTVGLVMAGNIPLVGFHDFLSVFMAGHRQVIKPSSKDEVLIRHLAGKLISIDPAAEALVSFAERLNGCDAYIATGSNNSARYFEYYFSKYPHIIRRNRTSAAVLTGRETEADLSALADDVYQYFGLGCRNVTKLYVPENYDFVPLLDAFRKYEHLADLAKYKHNYDYQLTILLLNKKYYMTNGSILLEEHPSPFTPISVLHFNYYPEGRAPIDILQQSEEIQCIVGHGQIPFGKAQLPELTDYADGIDTLQFLRDL